MADEVGKKLQKKGQNALMKLLHISERKFWMKKGELDRTKLSDIVFADRVELSVLNGIVHPKVKRNSEEDCKRRTQKYESDAD